MRRPCAGRSPWADPAYACHPGKTKPTDWQDPTTGILRATLLSEQLVGFVRHRRAPPRTTSATLPRLRHPERPAPLEGTADPVAVACSRKPAPVQPHRGTPATTPPVAMPIRTCSEEAVRSLKP